MRPPKVIALAGLPEHRACLLRYVLWSQGRRVQVYPNAWDAQLRGVDLVISVSEKHIRRIKRRRRKLPAILFSATEGNSGTVADAVFCLATLDMALLRVTMQVLLNRKRWAPPRSVACKPETERKSA